MDRKYEENAFDLDFFLQKFHFDTVNLWSIQTGTVFNFFSYFSNDYEFDLNFQPFCYN